MKNIFFIITSFAFFACSNTDTTTTADTSDSTSVTSNTTNATAAETTIEWIDPVVQDLGKANEGQILEITWRFKNTGNKPLVISDVRAGCGCTVAEKPQEPIAPGKEGFIKAKFDTNGQLQSQHKQVFVTGNHSNKNSEGEDVLGFKVEVAPKAS